jgi:hypothetical protein
MKLHFALIGAVFLLGACGSDESAPVDLDELARSYLFLELSMGQHDPAHVDAYFGPDELGMAAIEKGLPLADIDSPATEMSELLQAQLHAGDNTLDQERMLGLLHRLKALRTRIALRQGQKFDFDDESTRLFGTAAPDHDAAHFEAILDEIDRLLPGPGELAARVNEFRDQFVIPPQRLSAVFDAAIAECRRRTLEYIELPEHESFSLEYVTDKSWSGYNWYKGDAHSLIQINTDLPIFVSRAVDLGCHEGYPGHHTFNTVLEQNLVNDRGWIEYSLYPLFSPQSLIAEGSGNYGIELAFPGDDRVRFEREVLFPLAGLDESQADRYYELLSLLDKLNYAGNEAARDYLNGNIDRQQAIDWMVRYSLSAPERAEQRTRFFDDYRSYVINYNLGKDLVAGYVERETPGAAERWDKFEQLLSSPVHPSQLE